MKRLVLVGSAALMIGMIGCKKEDAAAPSDATPGQKTSNAISDAGQKVGDAAGRAVDATDNAAKKAENKIAAATQPSADTAIKDTRSTLGAVVEAAVTHDDLNKVIDHFSKDDRTRIGKVDKATLGNLNAAIDTFRADWKSKYGHDFKLSDKEEAVFGGPVQIHPGDITGGAQPASANPAVDPTVNNSTTVLFPAEGGAPAVTLRLVNDGTVMKHYKIVAAAIIDPNGLRDVLAKHITAVDAAKAQWPDDENQAYRVVSQHIFAAIADGK